MARFEFRDDDDGDDTDFDNPPNDQLDNNMHANVHSNYYGEKEEGEIIEDESIDSPMDESDDYEDTVYVHNGAVHSGVNTNMNEGENYRNSRFLEEESPIGSDTTNPGRSFQSYLPWRSRRRSSERSQSPAGSSFHAESSRDWGNENHENEFQKSETENINRINSDRVEGNEEYRLIGSTKYDRSYDRSDFYPSGIQSNNSYESNGYSNPISDDDENDVPFNNRYNSDRYRQEENSNRSTHSSDGALVRSSTQPKLSDGAPEVHYHIYVSEKQASRWFGPSQKEGPSLLSHEDFENDNSRRRNAKRKMMLWKRVTIWAVITQFLVFLVGRYNIVILSPPPSYLTWEEYRSHQFRLVHKFSEEAFSLLNHIARATILSAFSNNKEENNNFLHPRFVYPKEWKDFAPPKETETFQNKNSKNQNTAIFGQEEALEHLRNGLSLWSSSRKFRIAANRGWRRETLSSSDAPTQQQPLIVYTIGGRGVGKGALVYLILEQLESQGADAASVLEECAFAAERKLTAYDKVSFEEKKNQEHYCPLLYLNSFDYHNTNYGDFILENDESFSPIYQRILDHVVAAGDGASIVVLENVDSRTLPTSWLSDLMTDVQLQQSIFGNTIFVLTSQIGTNTLEKWTRMRLQALQGAREASSLVVAGNTEVEALLRYELKRHHDAENERGMDLMGIDNWLLLPMAPLDKNAIALTLQHIASNGRNPPAAFSTNLPILLTPSASNRILDALEWHQWIHKTTGEVLRIWSPDGASPLLGLWEEGVLRSITSLPSCPKENSSNKNALVLDFEGISTDRFWLRSCELVGEYNDQFDVQSNDGRRFRCLGASCSFYL